MTPILTAAQPTATSSTIWAFLGSPWGLLVCWLVVINLAAFVTFGIDKWKAKRSEKNSAVRRIPEKNLFLLAILGGSVGALLGMQVWHHKTLHKSFRIGIPLILLVQILIPAGLYLYWNVFHGA
ncbi:MAG: DUF1294 domain-containing protein [Oscillibacter sp.]|jgi:uncharacterized membrane protein YsdA (DUF1294 family)|nr:DUF1294 domain-containing protein [Oscillibacter sp.]